MIKDFILPDIGEGVVECELVEWLVKEGDTVVEDQPIADVMTDKALVQIPAPFAGVVTKLYYAKGDIAKVHAPLYAVEITVEESEPAIVTAKVTEPVAATSANPLAHYSISIEEFLLPDIGEGIVECELVEWLVSEGDRVEEDQPIADVMTDKALVQIPAIKAGKIAKLHYRKGQLAKVHAPLYAIEVEQTAPTATTNIDTVANTTPVAQGVSAELSRQGKALASPAVRRMARSLDIDLSRVSGTGKHGRVYKEDITRFQQGASMVAPVTQLNTAVQASQAMTSVVTQSADTVEPIRGVKAVMARMMV
ncbi:MAG: biotin/lipoyl-containing protein, partial [Shewanella sp.]